MKSINYFILVFVLLSPFSAFSAVLKDSEFLTPETCFSGRFSDFNSWYEMLSNIKKNNPVYADEKYKSELKMKYHKYKKSIECINFNYLVGDVVVRGFYIAPKKIKDKKYPLIVYNRGGNGSYGAVPFGAMMEVMFPLVEQGYVVVGSQYREFLKPPIFGISNPGKDEFGGADVDDVRELIDMADKFPGVNSKKIGLIGGSRGAMMAYMAARNSKNISTIISVSGLTNLFDLKPVFEKEVFMKRIPNYRDNKQDELTKRSAVFWVDDIDINVPILMLHGSQDDRVSVSQPLEFAKKLSEKNHPYRLVIYENAGHSLSSKRNEILEEQLNWLNEKLK